jgi:hypothetical protein
MDPRLQTLIEQVDKLDSFLIKNDFTKTNVSPEMEADFAKIQSLLEGYLIKLYEKKAKELEDKEQKEDNSLLDPKVTKVKELLKDAMRRDFNSFADKWPEHTKVIASHRDMGQGGVWGFMKSTYNSVVNSAGADLVKSMQPFYDSLAKLKAENSLKPQ